MSNNTKTPNGDMPPAMDPDVRDEIDGYIGAINLNPDLGTMLQSHFMQWKRGRLVLPASQRREMMWESYCEGVNQGIRAAVTAIVLARVECEGQDDLPNDNSMQL